MPDKAITLEELRAELGEMLECTGSRFKGLLMFEHTDDASHQTRLVVYMVHIDQQGMLQLSFKDVDMEVLRSMRVRLKLIDHLMDRLET